jgi:uncharacterized RDD family membrane protein YckC
MMQLLNLAEAQAACVKSYADFSDRLLAKVIDWIVLAMWLLPLDSVFGTSFIDSLHRTRVEGLIAFALFCIYSAVLESSKHQATWGKRAVGILVTDRDGNRISFARALVRSVMQYTGTGYLLAAFTRNKQALHDLLAETVVIPGTL